MGKPSPPPAPDYQGAAQAQGQANLDAAVAQGKLNNPNVVNPYGTQTVTYGSGVNQSAYDQSLAAWEKSNQEHLAQYGKPTPVPKPTISDFTSGDPNQATITQKLSPEQQALYDQSVKTQGLLGGLAQQGAQSLQGVVGKNLDLSGLPAAPSDSQTLRNQMIDAAMSRVNEDYGRQKDQTNSDLIAAGIRPGSKAYDDQVNLLNRGVNDARQQAILNAGTASQQAFNMDAANRQRAMTELLAQRQTPLNEITALMSGSQVSNPFTMPGYSQTAQVGAAPVYGATQAAGDYSTDVFNAKNMQQANLINGLFGLGKSGIMAFGAA